MAGNETRIINLRLDASQMNRAMQQTATNTEKMARAVDSGNKSLRQMEKEMKSGVKAAQDFNRSIVVFRRAMTALFAIRIAEGFISELQAVDNQLKIATDSTEDYIFMQERLLQVSQETRQSFEGTVKLYARIVRANDELGLSSNQIVKITENINKALAAQGASAQESRSVLLQLSQAFGSGRLAGEEFRAVAEGAPLILKDLAASLNVNVGALKDMAAAGLLTADVLAKALQEAAITQAEYDKANLTLGQSLVKLADSFRSFVRDMNDSTGGFSALADAISVLADNIRFLASMLVALIAIKIGGFLIALAAAAWTASTAMVALTRSTGSASIALGFLGGAALKSAGKIGFLSKAIARIPLVAAVLAIGWFIDKLDTFASAVGGFGNAWDIIWLEAGAIWKNFAAGFIESIPVVSGMLSGFTEQLRKEAAELSKEAVGIQDKFLLGQLAAADKANQKGKIKPKTSAEKDAERVTKLAEKVITDLKTATQLYNAAEADIREAVMSGQLDNDLATKWLDDYKKSLDPTTKAAEDFAKIQADMSDAVLIATTSMTAEELAFRRNGDAAGKNRTEVDAAWKVQKEGQAVLDRTIDKIEAEELALKSLADKTSEWASAVASARTPQEAYWQSITRLKIIADELNISMAVQSKIFQQIAQDYHDGTDEAKALKKAQEDLVELGKQLNSQFDNDTIVAEYAARQELLDKLLLQGSISWDVYNKELVRMDQEKNLRLIENGTKTMQLLSQASNDFVSGFGDAMIDFATGGEDAFEDFAKSFVSSMADMVVQTLILIPLMEALNALIANMGTVSTTTTGGGGSFPGIESTRSSFKPSGLSAASASINTAGAAAASSVVRATSTAVTGSSSSSSRTGGNNSGGSQVNVIVNNSSPAQVDVRQSQTSDGTELEILVTNAVRQGFQNGQMDETMSATYGIQRRGY